MFWHHKLIVPNKKESYREKQKSACGDRARLTKTKFVYTKRSFLTKKKHLIEKKKSACGGRACLLTKWKEEKKLNKSNLQKCWKPNGFLMIFEVSGLSPAFLFRTVKIVKKTSQGARPYSRLWSDLKWVASLQPSLSRCIQGSLIQVVNRLVRGCAWCLVGCAPHA